MDSVQGRSRRPASFRRKLLFAAVACLLGVLFLEFVAGASLYLKFGNLSSVWRLRSSVAARLGPVERESIDLLHPYQGYVREMIPNEHDPDQRPISSWGYVDSLPPLRQRAADRVVVAIMGGSVAEDFSTLGTSALAEELGQDQRFAGRRIEFVNMAVGGYKQPQQLMALTYLLTLRGEFDIVINLDGFNDIALSVTENAAAEVFPSFPRNWHMRVLAADCLSATRLRGKTLLLEEHRQKVAQRFERFPWRYSRTAASLWTVWDRHIEAQILEMFKAYRELAEERRSPAAGGPFEPFSSEEELYRHCVEVWQESSRQLHRLCGVNGIDYYHFLQPNQYLPGSKVLSSEERQTAYHEDQLYRTPVEIGYPLLIRAGEELAQEGVNFHDLTRIFAETTETLYIDNCCHLNSEGNRLLALRIGELIRRQPDSE